MPSELYVILTITCVIRCARLALLKELLSIEWKSALHFDCELSCDLLTVIRHLYLFRLHCLEAAVESPAETPFFSQEIQRPLKWWEGAEWKLWGLRSGQKVKHKTASWSTRAAYLLLIYLFSCVSPPSPLSPLLPTWLQTHVMENSGPE